MSDHDSSDRPGGSANDESAPSRKLALHWKILIGLIVGMVAGLIANLQFTRPLGIDKPQIAEATVKEVRDESLLLRTGESKTLALKPDGRPPEKGVQIVPFEERKEEQTLELRFESPGVRLLNASNVEIAGSEFVKDEKVELISENGELQAVRRKTSPLAWFTHNIADTIGQVFLRLIFMIVLPLVFSALVLGVAGIGDVRKLGRMGLRTLFFTLILSGASVAIGLFLANAVQPGRMEPAKSEVLKARYTDTDESRKVVRQAGQAKSLSDILLDIIPKNPLQEAVGALDGSSPGGGMLAVMFFALLIGIAMTLLPEQTGTLVAALEGVYAVCMTLIGWAMKFAPIGVAGLMFSLTSLLGFDILVLLAWFVGTVVAGLAFHMFVVYSIVVYVFARMSPLDFFRRSREAILVAFGTSSSNATLPTALRVAENELRLKPEVGKFVLTVGSTANQNGTALFEGIVILFLAQVFARDLSLQQQFIVILMAILAGVGTAGVPGGSLPLIAVVLSYVDVPAAGIGIIIGVDRILDMCRTTINVTGDLAVATCVDRTERGLARQLETAPP